MTIANTYRFTLVAVTPGGYRWPVASYASRDAADVAQLKHAIAFPSDETSIVERPAQALDDMEVNALRLFAHRHGRTWKMALREVWETANPQDALEGTLYPLRNRLGPAWLRAYRLAK